MSRVDIIQGYNHAREVLDDARRHPAFWCNDVDAVEAARGNLLKAANRYPRDYAAGMRKAVEEAGQGH